MKKSIKFYGLTLRITKQQYVSIQLAVLLILSALWIWAIFGDFNNALGGFGIPLLIIVTIGEILETHFTLKQFRQK